MKRVLKILGAVAAVFVLVLLAAIVYVLAAWDRPDKRPVLALTAQRDSATVARGRYLFTTTWQCFGCHQSGPANPTTPPSGGRVFDLRNTGPGFGLFYSKNITPDSATGIGAWSDGEIVQAFREGVNKSRHTLFPIMPVDWLKELSDDDALAIVAYLRSLPPTRNEVPPNKPSFFARALFAFNVIAPMSPVTQPIVAPPPGITAEYGRYLSMNAAGCADCHTPRNLQDGKFYLDSLFAGSSFAFGEDENSPASAYARNITPHASDGIGTWTEAQFVAAVTSGMRPDTTVLTPHMPYPYYKFFSAEDLRAIFLFLKTLPPIQRAARPLQLSPAFVESRNALRGKFLFESRCQSCHGPEGTGVAVTSVKLAEAIPIYSDTDLKEAIRTGVPDLKMPTFRKTLSEDELSDLVTYVRSWKRE